MDKPTKSVAHGHFDPNPMATFSTVGHYCFWTVTKFDDRLQNDSELNLQRLGSQKCNIRGIKPSGHTYKHKTK